ncbi:MAG: triose-phosphate isomerase [Caldiserica bacterium]|nr:MAG: triose-phosphate isomerase [Caldisericota bacterium]
MRKPIIAGNWKMHKTLKEAEELANGIRDSAGNLQDREIVLCPPFTALLTVKNAVSSSNIKVGAQDMFWEDEGAYTGEVSGKMLMDIGCEYVIIGHSERRKYFGENDQTVNKKVKKALDTGLTPIVCVGETLEEREKGITMSVVRKQVLDGLKEIEKEKAKNIVIAYEPVWAIGTGKTATPEQAQEVHAYIRKLLGEIWDNEIAENIRILYGGSIKPENIKDLMKEPDIDGGLVGGASLKADSFLKIIFYDE